MLTAGEPSQSNPWDPMLEELYRRHFDELVASAQRMLRDSMLAEEVVQEAFLRFHVSDARPTPGCELSYLRSIALNAARALLRRKAIGERKAFAEPPPSPSVEAECLRSESHAMLSVELEKLPRRQREVIMLRYCADMSEADTAELLNIGPGSVKTHAWRGRAALRDALSDKLAS